MPVSASSSTISAPVIQASIICTSCGSTSSKLDRRFIQELVITGESAVFIRAMVGLSRGLNLSVTAEGVETEAQAKAVLEHGVDQAQGFLFGKAVPAAQVPQLFAAPAQMVA